MNKKGLTLIEILITISIIGITAAGLVITVSQYLPSINLGGASDQVVDELRLAQERAITEQRQNGIKFYPLSSPVRYELIRIGDSGREIIKDDNFPTGITLTPPVVCTDNEIFFSSDGGPTCSGNIVLNQSSTTRNINVSPAGYIKIQ